MKKIILSTIIISIILSGCTDRNQNNSPETILNITETITNSNQKLLFFMAPDGAPCKMQNEILKNMGDDLSKKAELVYIKTTELETARPYFEKYGIRAIPSLILVDESGETLKRFTPGIHSKETIVEYL